MVNYNVKDEWIVGESVDGQRQYIIHCLPPRFVAEIFDNDEGGNDIGEFEFIDEPPKNAAALAKLARRAGDALAEHDQRLENDLENYE